MNRFFRHIWFLASGILQIACCIDLLTAWFRYSEVLNSAPFSVTVLVDVVSFGVPAAVCFLIGLYFERRTKGKEDSYENRN